MSRDIRSFFAPVGGGKKKADYTSSEQLKKRDTKMKTAALSDDDENIVNLKTKSKAKKKTVIVLSDSDEDIIPKTVKKRKNTSSKNDTVPPKVAKKVPTPPSLNSAQPIDIFGSEQIKRSKEKTAPVKQIKNQVAKTDTVKADSTNYDVDLDFEATLQQLDLAAIEAEANEDLLNKTRTEEDISVSAVKQSEVHVELNAVEIKAAKELEINLVKTKGKPDHATEIESSSKRKRETPDTLNSSVNDDEDISSWANDPAEKRRLSAIGYQRYLQRDGPKHLGTKNIPEGKPDSLKGLIFVVTGVLDSMERDAAVELIKTCGGKVSASVSRNTSYLVSGEDAGPSKLHKAQQYGTKFLDEDGLLDLIRSKSDIPLSKPILSKNKTELVKESCGKEQLKEQIRKKVKLETCSIASDSAKETQQEEKVSSSILSRERLDKSFLNTIVPVHGECSNEDVKHKTLNPTGDHSILTTQPPSLLWVDKYSPKNIKQIIGQQGPGSNVSKLFKWLENWQNNQFGGKKIAKPSPWARNDDGAFFKAALLSGSPGIGKTTSAHLVCKELGYDIVEFNASDTRSKRLLHEEVSELLSSKSLFEFFKGGGKVGTSSKHVLVMDEVDGMAGNQDRGGIGELIQLIKHSKVPIICMCNDHNHQKIRSLTNYCFDLKFTKPRVEQIMGAMMSVCHKENLKIPRGVLNDTIVAASQDIRQVLHYLSLYSANSQNLADKSTESGSAKQIKNIKLGPWDVLKKVFSSEEHKNMTINDKSDLFFHDYSMSPLFVQENYLSVAPDSVKQAKKPNHKRLDLIAAAADSMCWGDVVDKSIRNKQAWSLLPVQAMYASVIPGNLLEGTITSQINFPSWLGKNSRRNKFDRLLQELHSHARLSISGNKQALNLDYMRSLCDGIVNPLHRNGSEGISTSIDLLHSYHLLRTDIESIVELSIWPKDKDPFSSIDSKVKAALTRAFNKDSAMLPYSTAIPISKKKTMNISVDGEFDNNDNDDEAEEENDNDITADAMIKAKKQPTSKKGKIEDVAPGNSVPSKKGKGKGKGKSN